MNLSRRDFVKAGAAAPLAGAPASAAAPSWKRHFRDDHDQDLPLWGPYTNRYIGISHVAGARRGLRFDLAVFPGYYRRKVTIPHGRWESDFHPWEASADLNYYSFRHQLEWKDRVYCEASYTRVSDHSRLIRCECVNATARRQNLVVNLIAYLTYPGPRHEAALPEGAVWIDALDYRRLAFATPRPQDNLNYDGLLRGEALDEGFTGASGLGKNFGRERGDTVEYRVELPAAIGDAALTVRYRAAEGATARFRAAPLAGEIALEGTGAFRTVTIRCGALDAGPLEFRVVSEGTASFDLDGLVLGPAAGADRIAFRPEPQNVHPEEIVPGQRANSVLVKYRGLGHWYGIAWNHPRAQVRQYLCGELDTFFKYRVQDHVSLMQRGPGEGHFTNVFLRPIPIAPQSREAVHGMVCDGTREDVERMLQEFPAEAAPCERIWAAGRERRVEPAGLPQGRNYEFSQRRIGACALTNVFFPVYLKRHYIKHTDRKSVV